jgi:hypothetical protein
MLFKIVKKVRGCGNGTVCITDPPHPNRRKDGYVRHARVVMENHIGRLLTKDEIVVHRDGLAHRDGIENLELFVRKEFNKQLYKRSIHATGTWAPMTDLVCPVCNDPFQRLNSEIRHRKKTKPNVPICCSSKCAYVMRKIRREKAKQENGGHEEEKTAL